MTLYLVANLLVIYILPWAHAVSVDVGIIKVQPKFLEPVPEATKFQLTLNYSRLMCDVLLRVHLSDTGVLSSEGKDQFLLTAIPNETMTTDNVLQFRSKQIGTSFVSFSFTKPDNTALSPFQRPETDGFSVTVVRKITLLDELLQYASITFLYLSVIAMGSEVKLSLLQSLMKRPGCVGASQVTIMIIQPFVAFCLSKLFSLSPSDSLYLIMIGCCPGGGPSNMMAMIIHGEITLSFVITFMSTVMSMGWMPLNLFTYSNFIGDTGIKSVNDISVPYGRMIINIVKLSIPILCGMLLRYFFPSTNKKRFKRGRLIICAAMLIHTISQLYSTRFVLHLLTKQNIAVASLLPLSGLLAGAALTSLSRQRMSAIKTVILETGIQDTSLVALIIRDLKKPPVSDLDCAIPYIYTAFSLFYAFILTFGHQIGLEFSSAYSDSVEADIQEIEDEAARQESHPEKNPGIHLNKFEWTESKAENSNANAVSNYNLSDKNNCNFVLNPANQSVYVNPSESCYTFVPWYEANRTSASAAPNGGLDRRHVEIAAPFAICRNCSKRCSITWNSDFENSVKASQKQNLVEENRYTSVTPDVHPWDSVAEVDV